MATPCTASGTILKGDAVCVTGWDAGAGRPTVSRATAANLATSKTVFGVAQANAGGGAVNVRVAGEVAEDDITSLGAGDSRIIATDINAASDALQCRLIRVDRPDGSEHVVGTCDENGNLGVQPRASLDTSARHMANVRAFGAVADGKVVREVTMAGTTALTGVAGDFDAGDIGKKIRVAGADPSGSELLSTVTAVNMDGSVATLADSGTTPAAATAILWLVEDHANAIAITDALDTIPDGGTLFFPGPGLYVVRMSEDDEEDDPAALVFPPEVEVVFDAGAVLVAASASLTFQGPVTTHPLRQVFSGAGWVEPGAQPAMREGFVTTTGDPYSEYDVKVTIVTGGGIGAATFTYAVNNNTDLEPAPGPTSEPIERALGDLVIPGTGLTLHFDPMATYVANDEYHILAHAPFALAPRTLEQLDIMTFGVVPDSSGDAVANVEAMHLALGALRAGGNAATNVVARGKFFFDDTIHVCQTVALRGSGRQDAVDGAGAGASGPGTWFVFPRNTDGIHVYSGYAAQGGGDHTQIRDLTVAVAEEPADPGQTGNGITLNAIATLDHVTVKFFGNHGILVSAGVVPPATFGIAAGFVLDACVVGRCRGDGFHFVGSDANVGTIKACNAAFNRGFGFRDRTVINTYVGCHADGNLGLETNADDEMETVYRNYAAFGLPTEDLATSCNTNNCVYIGCYSEGDSPAVKNMIGAGATIIGGQPGYQQQPSIRDDLGETDLALTWAGWIISSNEVQGQPLSSVKVIPDPGDDGRRITTTIEIGQKTDFSNLADPVTNEPGIFNFRFNGADEGVRSFVDYNRIRYDEVRGWWVMEKGPGPYMLISADVTPPRRPALLFPNGIFFGNPSNLTDDDRFGPPNPIASKEIVNHTGFASKPTQGDVTSIQTWEVGDIAWNTNPGEGGPLGWRCIRAGTWAPDMTPAVTVTIADSDQATFSENVDLWLWSYLALATLDDPPVPRGIVQVVSRGVEGAEETVTIDTPVTNGGPLSVTFAPPRLVPFGNRTSVEVTDDYLATDDDYLIACKPGAAMTVTLPDDADDPPFDGQQFVIKDANGTAHMNNITVAGSMGHPVDAAPFLIDVPWGCVTVQFSAVANMWLVISAS